MNITVYFNRRKLLLSEGEAQVAENQDCKVIDGSKKPISNYKAFLETFLDETSNTDIVLNNCNVESTFNKLKKEFYYIEAAGGFIENNKKYLFIHRHGRWDLPKGKLEKGETPEVAAIRECEEECGVQELKIIKPLNSTFHIYKYKDGYALKQSFWFYMATSFNKKLTPQVEESIDQVGWFDLKRIETEILGDTYFTISDVIKQALSLQFKAIIK